MSTRAVFLRLCEPVLALTVLVGSPAALLLAQNPAAPSALWAPETPAPAKPNPMMSGPPTLSPNAPFAPAQAPKEPLRLSRNVAGDATPITLSADEVATWKESDQVIVVLLAGKVLVQHATVQMRCDTAVARINVKAHRERGLWHVDLFGEGQVKLDTALEAKEGARAIIDLTTRGEIKVQSAKAKVLQKVVSDSPTYRRALAETAQTPAQPGTVRPVGMTWPSAPSMPALPMGPGATSPFPVPPPPVVPPPPQIPAPTIPPPTQILAPTIPPPPQMPVPPPPVAPTIPQPPPSSPTPVPVGEPLPPLRPMSAASSAGGTLARAGPDVPKQDRYISFQFTPGPPDPPPPGANNVPPFLPSGPPSGPSAVPGPTVPRPSPLPGPAGTVTLGGRNYSVRQRYGSPFRIGAPQRLTNGDQAIIVTGGVIVNVRGGPPNTDIDLEADRLVIFTHGNNAGQTDLRVPQSPGPGNRIEFYLSGKVEIRQLDSKKAERTLRAEEVYYDVDRNVAVALTAIFEARQPGLPDPIVVTADELLRTSATTYELTKGMAADSKLPSDPGLKVVFATATMEDRTVPRISLFGREVVDRATGQVIRDQELYVIAHNVYFDIEGVPVFYLPYVAGNARDPLGPVQSATIGYSKIFGFDLGVTLNAYELLGIQPYEGTRWRVNVDYLSARGPAFGTTFENSGKDFLGIPSQHYDGIFKSYNIYDHGQDDLGDGGTDPQPFMPTAYRGRTVGREGVYDLPDGFTVQGQFGYVSDRNFVQQYFNSEWNSDIDDNTFLYVKQQGSFWAWSGLVEDRLNREWLTETNWLPRGDGYLLGVSLFDRFTYNAHASIGYAQLRTSDDPNYNAVKLSPTDVPDSTGRVDLMQDVSYPLALGAFKIVPYLESDLAEYTNDVDGQSHSRAWGAAGLKASVPLSRLYPDVQSELFNLDGIYHKVQLSGNYFISGTSASHELFPQLDRLNDDAGDQEVRDVRPTYIAFMPPTKAEFVTTSPLFDPQMYAMRQLLDTNPDLLDNMQVLQLDLFQRWQTKRGYPGSEHIIDWMTLDVSASFFPAPNRDNFGESWAFMQYDWVWNIGDRTALTSSAWVDPYNDGTKVFTFGAFLNRTDRTNFYLGYRQIEPLESRVVTAAATYVFSPKYSLTFSTAYDFGPANVQTNALTLTRIGTDLQVSMGFTYNSLQNNFGFQFEIVPNLAANTLHNTGPTSLLGSGGLASH